MSDNKADQGDLSDQISMLKRWIQTADSEGNSMAGARLIETLNHVVRDQDKRNVQLGLVLGRDAAMEYAHQVCEIVSSVLQAELEEDDYFRIIDLILSAMGQLELPENSEGDQKLLT